MSDLPQFQHVTELTTWIKSNYTKGNLNEARMTFLTETLPRESLQGLVTTLDHLTELQSLFDTRKYKKQMAALVTWGLEDTQSLGEEIAMEVEAMENAEQQIAYLVSFSSSSGISLTAEDVLPILHKIAFEAIPGFFQVIKDSNPSFYDADSFDAHYSYPLVGFTFQDLEVFDGQYDTVKEEIEREQIERRRRAEEYAQREGRLKEEEGQEILQEQFDGISLPVGAKEEESDEEKEELIEGEAVYAIDDLTELNSKLQECFQGNQENIQRAEALLRVSIDAHPEWKEDYECFKAIAETFGAYPIISYIQPDFQYENKYNPMQKKEEMQRLWGFCMSLPNNSEAYAANVVALLGLNLQLDDVLFETNNSEKVENEVAPILLKDKVYEYLIRSSLIKQGVKHFFRKENESKAKDGSIAQIILKHTPYLSGNFSDTEKGELMCENPMLLAIHLPDCFSKEFMRHLEQGLSYRIHEEITSIISQSKYFEGAIKDNLDDTECLVLRYFIKELLVEDVDNEEVIDNRIIAFAAYVSDYLSGLASLSYCEETFWGKYQEGFFRNEFASVRFGIAAKRSPTFGKLLYGDPKEYLKLIFDEDKKSYYYELPDGRREYKAVRHFRDLKHSYCYFCLDQGREVHLFLNNRYVSSLDNKGKFARAIDFLTSIVPGHKLLLFWASVRLKERAVIDSSPQDISMAKGVMEYVLQKDSKETFSQFEINHADVIFKLLDRQLEKIQHVEDKRAFLQLFENENFEIEEFVSPKQFLDSFGCLTDVRQEIFTQLKAQNIEKYGQKGEVEAKEECKVENESGDEVAVEVFDIEKYISQKPKFGVSLLTYAFDVRHIMPFIQKDPGLEEAFTKYFHFQNAFWWQARLDVDLSWGSRGPVMRASENFKSRLMAFEGIISRENSSEVKDQLHSNIVQLFSDYTSAFKQRAANFFRSPSSFRGSGKDKKQSINQSYIEAINQVLETENTISEEAFWLDVASEMRRQLCQYWKDNSNNVDKKFPVLLLFCIDMIESTWVRINPNFNSVISLETDKVSVLERLACAFVGPKTLQAIEEVVFYEEFLGALPHSNNPYGAEGALLPLVTLGSQKLSSGANEEEREDPFIHASAPLEDVGRAFSDYHQAKGEEENEEGLPGAEVVSIEYGHLPVSSSVIIEPNPPCSLKEEEEGEDIPSGILVSSFLPSAPPMAYATPVKEKEEKTNNTSDVDSDQESNHDSYEVDHGTSSVDSSKSPLSSTHSSLFSSDNLEGSDEIVVIDQVRDGRSPEFK